MALSSAAAGHGYDELLPREMADEFTKKRVAAFTIALGRGLGRSDQDIRITARAAILRDAEIDGIPFTDAAEIVAAQHESFDGMGFPRGLKADEIPLGARILRVADALDALLTGRPPIGGNVIPWLESERPSHHPVSISKAKEQIQRASGTLFDPNVVNVFLSMPDGIWDDLIELSER
jgi:HD-GYP domain-containing protein (c-di-GMP phosphodiesterase class II)